MARVWLLTSARRRLPVPERFRSTSVFYDRLDRVAGESKYPLGKMIKLALILPWTIINNTFGSTHCEVAVEQISDRIIDA